MREMYVLILGWFIGYGMAILSYYHEVETNGCPCEAQP